MSLVKVRNEMRTLRRTLSMSEVIRSKRGQAVLISLRNYPDRYVGGKTVLWTVLSGEGHGSGANGLRPRAGRSLPPSGP